MVGIWQVVPKTNDSDIIYTWDLISSADMSIGASMRISFYATKDQLFLAGNEHEKDKNTNHYGSIRSYEVNPNPRLVIKDYHYLSMSADTIEIFDLGLASHSMKLGSFFTS